MFATISYMNREFETLEHTSELKIRAFGKTKKELFLNMMKGMTAALRPKVKRKNEKVKRTITLTSLDIDTLLVDFLSEVLYLTQVEREVYTNATFKSFSDTYLEAELTGQKAESFAEDIKAATHHGVNIHKNKNILYQVDVIYDI